MATNKSPLKTKAYSKKIASGIVLILIAALFKPVLSYLHPLLCTKEDFGKCSLSSDLAAYIIGIYTPLILVVIGLAIITVAIIKARKK